MINPEVVFHFQLEPQNTIKNNIDECYEGYWSVPADLPYFQGHFSNQPILPAVGILDANTFFLKKNLKAPFKLKRVVSAKFTAPVTPNMKVKIKVSKRSESTWACEWKEVSRETNENISEKLIAQMVLFLS